MKGKYVILLSITALIFVSCVNNEPEIDWTDSEYYLSGYNSNYVQFLDHVSIVRTYNDVKTVNFTRLYNKGKLIKWINSSREEHFTELIYDQNWKNIIEECLVVEGEKISDNLYSYEYDNNSNEKITTVTDEKGNKKIYKEVRKKSGIYECEISHENKIDKSKIRHEYKTAKFDKLKIIEYTVKDNLRNELYRFEYKENNLIKLSHYNGKSQALIFTYDYEYENNKLCKVICKRYNNPSSEEEIIYTIFFSNFDSHGNWLKSERVYNENDRSIINREIVYDDEIIE